MAINAGSPVLTGVGIALVHLQVAGGASPAWRAVADEPGDVVLTGAALAGIVPTLVNISLTSLPVPPGSAPAGEVVDEVCALPTMETGAGQTLVHILLAQPASVAGLTPAVELVDPVHTLAVIETGVAGALVHVDLTVGPVGS